MPLKIGLVHSSVILNFQSKFMVHREIKSFFFVKAMKCACKL